MAKRDRDNGSQKGSRNLRRRHNASASMCKPKSKFESLPKDVLSMILNQLDMSSIQHLRVALSGSKCEVLSSYLRLFASECVKHLASALRVMRSDHFVMTFGVEDEDSGASASSLHRVRNGLAGVSTVIRRANSRQSQISRLDEYPFGHLLLSEQGHQVVESFLAHFHQGGQLACDNYAHSPDSATGSSTIVKKEDSDKVTTRFSRRLFDQSISWAPRPSEVAAFDGILHVSYVTPALLDTLAIHMPNLYGLIVHDEWRSNMVVTPVVGAPLVENQDAGELVDAQGHVHNAAQNAVQHAEEAGNIDDLVDNGGENDGRTENSDELLAGIAKLRRLRALWITQDTGKFPESVLLLTKLRVLGIKDDRMTHLPPLIHTALPQLRWFSTISDINVGIPVAIEQNMDIVDDDEMSTTVKILADFITSAQNIRVQDRESELAGHSTPHNEE